MVFLSNEAPSPTFLIQLIDYQVITCFTYSKSETTYSNILVSRA